MNRTEHLLQIFSEECVEVSQRISKAIRFGINEIQDGQTLTNHERITYEFADICAIFRLLTKENIILPPLENQIEAKIEKINKYLKYSEEQGTLK